MILWECQKKILKKGKRKIKIKRKNRMMIGTQILINNNQKVNSLLKEMMMIGKTVQTDFIKSIFLIIFNYFETERYETKINIIREL